MDSIKSTLFTASKCSVAAFCSALAVLIAATPVEPDPHRFWSSVLFFFIAFMALSVAGGKDE